jgi:hypothetical protein
MKRILILVLPFLTYGLNAQELSGELIELKPPGNPAMTLMGAQTTEISRPKSLNQLETTLASSYSGGGLAGIPNDFGLEVMPYWLKPRPEKVFDRTALSKNECAPLENLSISLGSVNKENSDSTTRTQIGFGVRTLIFSGIVSDADLERFDRLNGAAVATISSANDLYAVIRGSKMDTASTYQQAYNSVAQEYKDLAAIDTSLANNQEHVLKILKAMFLNEVGESGMDKEIPKGEAKALKTKFKDMVHASVNADSFQQAVDSVSEARVRKSGFMMEVAAATYLDFPTGEIEFSVVPKVGGWLTLSYRMPEWDLDVVGLARYIRDFELEENTQNFDVGMSLSFTPGKLNVTGELIQRFQNATVIRTLEEDGVDFEMDDTRQDYRLAFNASYTINDSMVISYSLGKRFDFSDGFEDNLLSMLGLNFGFGKVPLVGAAQALGVF